MLKRLGRKVASFGSKYLIKTIQWTFRIFGVQLLSREQTIAFLEPNQILTLDQSRMECPAVANLADPASLAFEQKQAVSDPAYVWSLNQGPVSRLTLLPYGAVSAAGKILCTDFNKTGFFKDLVTPRQREKQHTNLLLAPWSHYLDGIGFGGYYDFVLLVAAKLARMKEALSTTDFAQARVSYPLFNTQYEREYLNLLGIEPGQVVDSRFTSVAFDRVILGNSGHWFYPNAADIHFLKKHVENRLQSQPAERSRIYISRVGRRRVTNEDELIAVLKKYDFRIIEDISRSVAEQVVLYKNASFIIGPHGASFSNIIWCEPGTHLLELFSPNYRPDFFLYMATLLGLGYSAYFHGTPDQTLPLPKALVDNMVISVPELEQVLQKLL